MNIIDFFITEQKRLHNWMGTSVSDLTLEEWHYMPQGNGNSIAFLVWHCVRTEDNILRFILQRRPPRWNEEARAFRIADPKLFMQYAESVWQEFEEYLAAIPDGGAELSERAVTVKPLGGMMAVQAIGQACITHCFMHFGEIACMLGELGKQGMPA